MECRMGCVDAAGSFLGLFLFRRLSTVEVVWCMGVRGVCGECLWELFLWEWLRVLEGRVGYVTGDRRAGEVFYGSVCG